MSSLRINPKRIRPGRPSHYGSSGSHLAHLGTLHSSKFDILGTLAPISKKARGAKPRAHVRREEDCTSFSIGHWYRSALYVHMHECARGCAPWKAFFAGKEIRLIS